MLRGTIVLTLLLTNLPPPLIISKVSQAVSACFPTIAVSQPAWAFTRPSINPTRRTAMQWIGAAAALLVPSRLKAQTGSGASLLTNDAEIQAARDRYAQ